MKNKTLLFTFLTFFISSLSFASETAEFYTGSNCSDRDFSNMITLQENCNFLSTHNSNKVRSVYINRRCINIDVQTERRTCKRFQGMLDLRNDDTVLYLGNNCNHRDFSKVIGPRTHCKKLSNHNIDIVRSVYVNRRCINIDAQRETRACKRYANFKNVNKAESSIFYLGNGCNDRDFSKAIHKKMNCNYLSTHNQDKVRSILVNRRCVNIDVETERRACKRFQDYKYLRRDQTSLYLGNNCEARDFSKIISSSTHCKRLSTHNRDRVRSVYVNRRCINIDVQTEVRACKRYQKFSKRR